MRKLFFLFVALFATTCLWAQSFQSGYLYYNITSSSEPYTVEVTCQESYSSSNYSGLITATIPETVTNYGTTYSVTSIGNSAFFGCSSLTSITIPESVMSIGEYAFQYCSSLTSITIPESVTSIGDDAFYGCSSLVSIVWNAKNFADFTEDHNASFYSIRSQINSFTFGEKVEHIPAYLCYYMDKLTSIAIPNSVTSIGSYAFSRCSSLTSITIPENVTSIGNYAFSSCSSLTSITIPNSVTSIGKYAFNNCSSLTSMVVESGNTTYDSRENCNAIIETKSNTVIAGCQNTVIPNSVTSIGSSAFFGCSSLTSITIPNSVTSIGSSAFSGCSSLTSITIPNSVTTIEGATFHYCSSLTSITIPESVMSIGNYAFQYCSSLTSITIPKSVLNIGYAAFSHCSSLTSIIIPNSITTIEGATFHYCSSLNSITIPSSITNIENAVFWGCSSLTSITIPKSVTSIVPSAFYDCSSLTSMVVEEGNTTYDSRENCNGIIETTTNTLIAGCQSTIIPNSVTSIGDEAFEGCSSLTSITIPNSVTSIGDEAFNYCSSLTTMICEAIEVPELGNNVFLNIPLSEATLYVPAQSLDDYKAADQWKDFGAILLIEEEEPGEDVELQDTEMSIVFTNSEDNDSEIYRQTITLKVPTAPTIEGFTFLKWRVVEGDLTDVITIQAIYEADTPTSAEVYTNPANPAQKLLRNGQVYILQDGKTYSVMGQEM